MDIANAVYYISAALLAASLAVGISGYLKALGNDDWCSPKKGSRLDLLHTNARLRDFYRLAVIAEEDGRQAYLQLAELAKTPETRKLCRVLATKEAEHKHLIQGYLDSGERLPPNKSEWPVLLEQLVQAGIFDYLPERGATEEELAWYAIRQEVKTAKFYQSFEDSFPDSWRRLKMHELVEQELGHEKLIRAAYPQLPA